MPQVQTQERKTEQQDDLLDFIRDRRNFSLLNEACTLKIPLDKQPSPESKQALEKLVKLAGLRSAEYDLSIDHFAVGGNVSPTAYNLIDRTSGKITTITHRPAGPSSLPDQTHVPESLKVTSRTHLQVVLTETGPIRIARQLGLDPRNVQIEYSIEGKKLSECSKEERTGAKQLEATVGVGNDSVPPIFCKFDVATGKLLQVGKQPEGGLPVYSGSASPASRTVDYQDIWLPADASPSTRRAIHFAKQVNFELAGVKEEPAEMVLYSTKTGELEKIEIQGGESFKDNWELAAARTAHRKVAEMLVPYYADAGINEYLETGKVPKTASEEFKSDFRTDLNQMFGLEKFANTKITFLRPDEGPLAGLLILVLTGPDEIPIGSIQFEKDSASGQYQVLGTRFSEKAAARLEPDAGRSVTDR